MAVLKCKMCGGDLVVSGGMTVVECDFCGTAQTIPAADNEKKTNLFNRANRMRIANEFDRASGVYESIIGEFPQEAEAYWGLCLCKYGIEYVDDPKTAEKIPTCHRTSFASIFDDANYTTALSCADAVAKRVYEEEAKAIDAIQKRILTIVSREQPFDVFICYKETDDLGRRTVDSVIAQDVYEHLTDRGFKVFFARITLEDKLGQEYEPYIFAALLSAKVMLVIGTNCEYYNAVWVKNEWSRYLSLMNEDHSKMLIPCYRDVDPADMPPEFRNLQAQDMGKLGFIQDLIRGITKIVRGTAEKNVQTANASTEALLKRGYFFLEDGAFGSANEYFDKVLDAEPEEARAYVGKVLAGLQRKNLDEIADCFAQLHDSKDLVRAIRFSSGQEKAQLEAVKERADKKWLIKRLTVCLRNCATLNDVTTIKNKIATLAAVADPAAYDEIVCLCTDAYSRRIDRSYFNWSLIEKAKLQAAIIKVLAAVDESSTADISDTIHKENYIPGPAISTYEILAELMEMIKAGSAENGFTRSKYCLAGKKQQKMQDTFACAEKKMASASGTRDYQAYFHAADLFATLGDFKDSAAKAIECRQLGEQMRQTIEEEKKAEIREHNRKLREQIDRESEKLQEQQVIYAQNAKKIFGAGAKLKKEASAEIARLESVILDLKKKLKQET